MNMESPLNKKIKMADANELQSSQQPTNEDELDQSPSCEVNATTSDSLLTLNDDCLRKTLNYLDIENLCAVADVCQRTRRISEETFRKHHVDLEFHDYRLSVIRRALCKFGHLIRSLCISSGISSVSSRIDIGDIAKYATKIETLTFEENTLECSDTHPSFPSLKHLTLDNCAVTSTESDLFPYLPALVSLDFTNILGSEPRDVFFKILMLDLN